MNKIEKYNKLIEDIVFDFAKRLYQEDGEEEPARDDYRIMSYNGVNIGPVDIWDMYLTIDDILMCEYHNFDPKTVIDYYDLYIQKDGEPGINYYNFAKKSLNLEKYEKEEKEDLKKSEENVKKAELELKIAIDNHLK